MTESVKAEAREARNTPPISANLGVNPGWVEQVERKPPIPAFEGRAEIAKIAMVFTLWAGIEDFIYHECGVPELRNRREEKKHRSILLESETSIICMLCLLNDQHYSATGLVDAMVGEHATADERGNARKRLINRTLPIVAERYGLLKYSERMKGKAREYSICRSPRLNRYAKEHLIKGFQQITGATAQASENEHE